MSRTVERRVHVNGQNMAHLLTTLLPNLPKKDRCCRRVAWHGPKRPAYRQPLVSQNRRAPLHEGGHKHSHVSLPQYYGPVHVQMPRGRSRGY